MTFVLYERRAPREEPTGPRASVTDEEIILSDQTVDLLTWHTDVLSVHAVELLYDRLNMTVGIRPGAPDGPNSFPLVSTKTPSPSGTADDQTQRMRLKWPKKITGAREFLDRFKIAEAPTDKPCGVERTDGPHGPMLVFRVSERQEGDR